MTIKQLVSHVEGMTNHDRVSYMVALGKRGEVKLLAEMENGDFYGRWLSLLACYGSRDGARAARSLRDPSRIIRMQAIKMVPLLCGDDDVILSSLQLMPTKEAKRLLVVLSKRKRQAVIDAYVTPLLTDKSSSKLMVYASSETIANCATEYYLLMSPNDQVRMAKRHPLTVLQILNNWVDNTQEYNHDYDTVYRQVFDALSFSSPSQALLLLKKIAEIMPVSGIPIQRLAQKFPDQIAELVIANPGFTRVDFGKSTPLLKSELLIELIDQRKLGRHKNNPWAKSLSHEQFLQHGDWLIAHFKKNTQVIETHILELFDIKIRQTEARLHLRYAGLSVRPALRIGYAAFLPWDEVMEHVQAYLNDPNPDLRKSALSTLIKATRYQREKLPELINLLCKSQYEQDPVRESIFHGLADLPPSRWNNTDLQGLGQLIRFALDAKDLSPQTVGLIEKFLLRMLSFHPEWVVKWLGVLVKERGRINFDGFGTAVSEIDIKQIIPVITPVLSDWEKQDRDRSLLATANSLRHRIKNFTALLNILEKVLLETRSPGIADSILQIFRKYDKKRFSLLVPALLKTDRSWITCSEIHMCLHRYRQDLLPLMLMQKPFKGRFSTGKTVFVPVFYGGFQNWTNLQRNKFAAILSQIITDPQYNSTVQFRIIKQLALIPGIQHTALLESAQLTNTHINIRDWSLQALSSLDDDQGVQLLLDALDDDRARNAIYALRVIIFNMDAGRALSVLTTVSLKRVTVAKEVLRLIGELPGEKAFQYLLTQNNDTLHRDVRVALIRALWNHMERDEAWEIFNAAAINEDQALANAVANLPAYGLSDKSKRKLLNVFVLLLNHPDITVRLEILKRCTMYPISDPDRVLVNPLMQAIKSDISDEYSSGLYALMSTYINSDNDVIVNAMQSILPHRRSLKVILDYISNSITGMLGIEKVNLPVFIRKIINKISIDPLLLKAKLKLTIKHLPWSEVVEILRNAVNDSAFTAETQVATAECLTNSYRIDGKDIRIVEQSFIDSGDERLRHFALAAMIGDINHGNGWTDETREHLKIYQQDISPLIAAEAQFIFPPDKLTEEQI